MERFLFSQFFPHRTPLQCITLHFHKISLLTTFESCVPNRKKWERWIETVWNKSVYSVSCLKNVDLQPPFPSSVQSFFFNQTLYINITEETFLLLFSFLLNLILSALLVWPVIHISLIFQSWEALLYIAAFSSSSILWAFFCSHSTTWFKGALTPIIKELLKLALTGHHFLAAECQQRFSFCFDRLSCLFFLLNSALVTDSAMQKNTSWINTLLNRNSKRCCFNKTRSKVEEKLFPI